MVRIPITKYTLFSFFLFFLFSSAGYSQRATSSSSFRIRHTSTARYFSSRKYLHTRNNETVIAGKWGITEDGSDLMLMKLNQSGIVIWSKNIVVGIRLDEYEISEMSDGTIVLAANSQYNAAPSYSEILVIKFACSGDILWSRNLSLNTPGNRRYLVPYSIKEGKNNDALVSFYASETNATYTVLCRINNGGNLIWSKTFYGPSTGTVHPAVSFLSDNKIAMIGFNSFYTNNYNFYKSFFAMRLNYDDGNVEETKGFDYAEFLTYNSVLLGHPKIHFYVEQLDDGNFALYGEFSNFDKQKAYYYKLIINKDFTINQAKTFSIPSELATNWTKIKVFPNGQTQIVSANYEREMLYWYVVDKQDNKIREKKISYPNVYLDLYYSTGQSAVNRSTYIVSAITEKSSSIEVVQAEDNDPGIVPCLGTDTTFIQKLPWQASIGSMQWQAVKDNEVLLTPLQFTSSDISVISEYLCEPIKIQEPAISQLKIRGEDTICFPGSSYNYSVLTNNKTNRVQWALDSSENGSLIELNDSTISITFKKPVTGPEHLKLYAYANSCTLLKDSISITVFPEPVKLSGNFNICNLPLRLQPGPWFKSYLWQDGSTDSTYTVTKPGKYVIKLQTYCGDTFTDSIEIAEGGTGVKNRYEICKNDSVTIIAKTGFSKYTWTPSYNLLQIPPAGALVYPAKDTFYILKAQIFPGCELVDTIFIKVNEPTVINLGKDTALCSKDILTLNAGNNFFTYNWNSGNTSQNLVIDSPGIYFVTASDKNGCLSSDTISIQGKECQNAIYFPNAFSPNGDGKNDLFKPSVSGRLMQYELMVFNRFGEVVFKTSQVTNGWNGTAKGIQQKSDAFLWLCRYMFENETQKMEKGSLLLIR